MLLHTYACCTRPLHVCDRQKEKGSDKSDIDALPQLPISTGVPRLPWSVQLDRSRSPRSAIKSRVLQIHAYATRGLGFLVRCATISRQLGQGRLRSGGSPLFMINHMLLAVLTVSYLTTEGLEVWSFQLITRARDSRYRCVAYVRCMHVRRLEYSLWRKDK